MDLRGCFFVVIVFINCVCISFITASQEADRYPETDAGDRAHVEILVHRPRKSSDMIVEDPRSAYDKQSFRDSSLRGAGLEKKLREDIERELIDIRELENQLMGHLSLIHEKKRQLEIKKRQPVQCLVNIVSCWKRK